jgi:hypothetical protein
MPLDITGSIPRYEAGDTKQFTIASTGSRPATVSFVTFNTDGRTLALEGAQSGAAVVAVETPSQTGFYFYPRILPTSPGLYFYEWDLFDASSRPSVLRGEFEIFKTEPVSFFTYSDILDVTRTGRQIFGRADITQRDLRPYLEEADAFIDSHLGIVMGVPVTPTPNLLRAMSKVFALSNYYSDRYSVENAAAPPAIIARKDDYEKLLYSIVSGTAVLVNSGGTVARAEEEISAFTAASRVARGRRYSDSATSRGRR